MEEVARNDGTMLKQSVVTRWGSSVTMLRSVYDNRVTVENTLRFVLFTETISVLSNHSRLRREKYADDDFKALAWVWNGHIWDDWQNLLQLMEHVVATTVGLEKEDCTLGKGVELYIGLRAHLEQVKSGLLPALERKITSVLEARDNLFFKDWPCAANVMDPCFRGRSLSPSRLRETIAFILSAGV